MSKNLFKGLADALNINKIREAAFESGFARRIWKKISPENYFSYICLESVKGTVSHNDLSEAVGLSTGEHASRQAYWERTKNKADIFMQKILEELIREKHKAFDLKILITCGFKRILVQDSTIIRLPEKLFITYSGVKNAYKQVCNARIQGTYDLISGHFINFSIDPYYKNDLAVSTIIEIEPSDLWLRDRGYFDVASMRMIKEEDGDYVMRYKCKTNVFDFETGELLDLWGELKKRKCIDQKVFMGKEKLPVRIIAVPVDEETANLRRMKAKKEASGYTPSKENLALMSWTIFITSIDNPVFTFDILYKLYTLRWRIECIFKTWKSNFSFAAVHNVSEIQLRVLLTARLIMICTTYQKLYIPISNFLFKNRKKAISMLKFMRFIVRHFEKIIELVTSADKFRYNKMLDLIAKTCSYDKRKRKNYNQEFLEIVEVLNSL
jgi:hypothetical protein